MFSKFLISIMAVFSLATSTLFAQQETPPPTTTTDNKTGLIWQKCSGGQNDDATCSGTATTMTWSNAITYCTNLPAVGGKTWRLPHVNELKTIVDTTKASGATIDTTVFPATVAGFYWSSTTYAPTTTNAWYVYFFNGIVSANGKTTSYYVRCVSGP